MDPSSDMKTCIKVAIKHKPKVRDNIVKVSEQIGLPNCQYITPIIVNDPPMKINDMNISNASQAFP